MKEVSFIIPAYNAAETIGDTLNSIVASVALDSSQYEVIVVDDCSSDNTLQVLEPFKESICNLVVLELPVNSRQGAARNMGLKAADGRYIMFVDSDDLVLEGVNDALDLAKRNDADICFCPIFHEADDELWELPSGQEPVEEGARFCESVFNHEHRLLLSPCSGIYNLSFIRDVAYPFVEGHQAEDTDFVLKHLSAARCVCYCTSPIYHYVNNRSSTINRRDVTLLSDYLLLAERIMGISECTGDILPSFSRELKVNVVPMATNRLSLWYIGKLDIQSILSFYNTFSKERRDYICTEGVRGFPACVLKHKWISIGCMAAYKLFLVIFRHKLNND